MSRQDNLYLLLRIVKNDRNVNALLREKLTYRQIGDLIQGALQSRLIEKKNDAVFLTSAGEEVFEKLTQQFKKIKKEDWIGKEDESKIEQIDVNFLYLPNQLNLNLD
jgi:pyridoxal/pyridoxine/pyridoxamine kinase